MANKKPTLSAPSTAPTSELPFAARTCDLPYLDLVENGSQPAIDRLAQRIGSGSPAVQFAQLNNEQNLQLQGWVAVLKSVEECLKWAHRGGAPDGANAAVCFSRARSMLDLAVGQIEVMTESATSYLDEFCENEPGEGGKP